MAQWSHHYEVVIDEVYQKLPLYSDQFLIVLRWKHENSIVSETHHVTIQGSEITKKLERLLRGESEREYFAYGMRDIDIYRANQESTFAITHSPVESVNFQFVLKKGELEKLVNTLINKQPACM